MVFLGPTFLDATPFVMAMQVFLLPDLFIIHSLILRFASYIIVFLYRY